MQRLLDAGVMQIVAVTDPLQLGFARQAMVGVRTRGDARAVADALAEFAEVDYVVITAGSVDVLVEAVCEDDDQLLDIVARIRAVDGVESTETLLYLGLRKQTYAWGTRRPPLPLSDAGGLRPALSGRAASSVWHVEGSAARRAPGCGRRSPTGLSENDTVSTGMTGQSSGRVMWWMPKTCHSTMSVSAIDRSAAVHSGSPASSRGSGCRTRRPATAPPRRTA